MTTVYTDDSLLTVREVADTMRVSPMTVYRIIKAGDLDAIQISARLRIRYADLQRYFAAHTVAALDAPVRS